MLLQLLFVLVAIIIGARVGGIGLGILGGLGLAVLTFVFGLQPTAPPIDVMLMIVAVIAAASCMQAAGGLDLMVKWAEKILRKNPHHITLLSPFVTYFFTFFAGTGHVAYSGSSRYCRGCQRYRYSSGTSAGYRSYRFAAGCYCQPDIGSNGCYA